MNGNERHDYSNWQLMEIEQGEKEGIKKLCAPLGGATLNLIGYRYGA